MSNRFFSERAIAADAVGRTCAGWGGEAHHLIHVMRGKVGDTVELFDGGGSEFTAEIRRVGRSEVELAIVEVRGVDREAAVAVTLAVALPKGDRQRWLVEKATELGVSRLVPLITSRGVAQPVDRGLDRLRQTVIEASKQCGRNRLMEISPAVAWDEYVVRSADVPCRLFAHPGGEPDWRDAFERDASYRRDRSRRGLDRRRGGAGDWKMVGGRSIWGRGFCAWRRRRCWWRGW